MIPVGSLGDVIAICQVVAKIGIVLCDTRERPKDFAELEEELNSLYTILQGIKKLYDPSTSSDPSCIAAPLQKQVTECNAIMDDFMQKNAPPKKWYRKIIWALRESGRADSLRRKLIVQRLNLAIILQQFNAATGNSQLCGVMTEVKDFRTEFRMEVRELHFRMRGIDFEDATGTTVVIAPELCRSYEMLLGMIKLYYDDTTKQLPGRRLVLREQYQLVHGQNNIAVDRDLWDTLLSPGLVVKMSMILRRPEEQGSHCPKCQTEFEVLQDHGWVNCRDCGGRFSVNRQLVDDNATESEEEDEWDEESETADDSSTDEQAVSMANRGESRRARNFESPQIKRMNEWVQFRLISLVMMKQTLQPAVHIPSTDEATSSDEPPSMTNLGHSSNSASHEALSTITGNLDGTPDEHVTSLFGLYSGQQDAGPTFTPQPQPLQSYRQPLASESEPALLY